jgi:hypothetical protein
MIAWASEIRDVVCCLDPDMEIQCHEGGKHSPTLYSVTTQPVPLAVNCPPPPPTTAGGSRTTTAGDLCKALTLLIAWAEDIRDITCCIPSSTNIRVPAEIVAQAKLRKETLREMKPANILHTVSCPSPKKTASRKRAPAKRKRR